MVGFIIGLVLGVIVAILFGIMFALMQISNFLWYLSALLINKGTTKIKELID